MRSRAVRLIGLLICALALGWPASAQVRTHHAHATWRAGLHLVPLPSGGTLIRVHSPGEVHAVVVSEEAIAAAAIRDVDSDGDLDIVANGGRGLVVWRNLGQGRYVRAAPAPPRSIHSRPAAGLSALRQVTLGSGVGEQRSHVAAAVSWLASQRLPAVPPLIARSRAFVSQPCGTYVGRGPPICS